MAQAQPDASELDHGEERRAELVVARGDASVIFEFVEEALDEVALLVEPGAEADRTFAIGLGRDVGPAAALADHRAQPVGVIGLVAEHHLALAHTVEQLGRCLDVVVVAGRDDQLDRQPVAIGQSMDFRSKTAPAASQTSIRVAFFKVAAA